MIGLDVGTVIAHLRLDSTKFDAALKTSQQRMQSFAKGMSRVGRYMTVGLTLPIIYFAKKAVDSFAKFDDAMVRSAAVTAGAAGAMREEMRKTALDMSTRTILSATELAEGYFALGQAGYEVVQSMKALPIVTSFAIASQIELDTATRYLVRTMEGLGMATQDPIENMEQMKRVSDAFTFAAITTTAEIEDFAVAMTHAAAPALKLVNKSVEEGVSVLMAFAQAGIVAEEAGTLLWTTVRDLQRANIKARPEWKKLGIDVYDTAGKMRNIAEIFSDLEDKFARMSDEGKKVSLMMLGFQDRSLRGVQALMGFSNAMKLFQGYMAKGGDLTRKIADEYMKSFASQLKIAGNNLNVFAITIGSVLSPFIQKFNIQLIKFVAWWRVLPQHTKMLVVEIAALLAVAGPLLLVFGKILTSITWLSLGFRIAGISVLGLAKSFVIVTMAAAGWLAVIGVIVAAVYAAYAAWRQGMSGINERLLALQNAFRWTFQYLKDTVGPFLIWMVETFHDAFGLIISDWDDFSADLAATFTSTWQWMKQVKEGLVDFWNTDPWVTWSQAAEKMKASFRDAGNEWGQSFVKARDEAVRAIDEFKKEVMEGFETSVLYTKAYVEGITERMVELGQVMKTQFGKDFQWVADLITTKIKEMNDELMKMMPDQEWQEVVANLERVKKELAEMENIKYPINAWQDYVRRVKDFTLELVDTVINAFDTLADAVATSLEQQEVNWKKLGATVLHEINRMMVRMLMMNALTAVFPNLGESGAAMPGKILDEANLAAASSASSATQSAMHASSAAASASLAASIAAGNAAASMIGGGTTSGGVPVGTSPQVALGGIFDMGRMLAFARGGVVSGPSTFGMRNNQMGLMGEAGPEAIMPLSRTPSGELGIKATQPNINFNPQMKVIIVRDEKEAQLETMRSSAGEKIIVQKVARNRNVLG